MGVCCTIPALYEYCFYGYSVSHSLSWKLMKPHMATIVQEIVFPLMCHSDEDEELWQTDPVEYIRIKYG